MKTFFTAIITISFVVGINQLSVGQTTWQLTGNSISSGNYLGTTNTQPLELKTTNTGTPQPINFYTSNTQRATIASGGNFGIGLSSPSYRLDVSGGDINVSTTTNGYRIGGNYVLWHNNNQLVLGDEHTKSVQLSAPTHIRGAITAKQFLVGDENETKDLLALITELQTEIKRLKKQIKN